MRVLSWPFAPVCRLALCTTAFIAWLGSAHAETPLAPVPVPIPLRVLGELAPVKGVGDLKFGEFFKMPIGPRGLEPSASLRRLEGKPVRLVGYMARQDAPTPGMFILSPLPVHMGDEDDSFSDDLPAAAVFVHLGRSGDAQRLPFMPGLLALTGVLQLGAFEEGDGRVSGVRLVLSDADTQLLVDAAVSH